MNPDFEKQSTPSLIKIIKDNPNLLTLWNEVEYRLPNYFLHIITMSQYTQITGVNRAQTHYGFCKVAPFRNNELTDKDYLATIVIAPDALIADIGHELMHLYIHGIGYPFVIFNSKPISDSIEILEMDNLATRIHDIAVHPVIDRNLTTINLFDNQVWERMFRNYSNELQSYLKNPNYFNDKNYIVIRTIELQHRLPPEMWQQIETMFKERPSYQRLLDKIKQLPCFPGNLSPQSVYKYITDMWKYYRIKPEQLNLDLTINSPLLQNPRSS
ncbi:MAG TPA: hypothetical protein DIW17_19590 [Clostridiales bacterium]|jgi:hypothetical protein|nr:hypothetical protein [Clostridiales bacterium]